MVMQTDVGASVQVVEISMKLDTKPSLRFGLALWFIAHIVREHDRVVS